MDKSPKLQTVPEIQKPEPIYATIQPVKKSSQVASAFKPLPPPPDVIYENTRKLSLPALDQFGQKSKFFASSHDLSTSSTEPTGYPSTRNYSYHDISMVHQKTPSSPYDASHHGSTQSVFAGYGYPQSPSLVMSPNLFSNGHCHCQYWQASCVHCKPHTPHYGTKMSSLGNSFDELRPYGYDDSAELTDDEDEFGGNPMCYQKKQHRNRSKRTSMQRSQSTHTMYGGYDPMHHYCASPNHPCESPLFHQNEPYHRKMSAMSVSPTPSVKSLKSLKCLERHKLSDSMSDSSSSKSTPMKSTISTQYTDQTDSKPKTDFEFCNDLVEQINSEGQWSCRY